MRRFRYAAAAVMMAVMLLCGYGANSVYASASIELDSLKVTETGQAEVIGHLRGAEQGAQVTCLVLTENASEHVGMAASDILWVDQMKAGNNGVFLVRFQVNPRFSKKTVRFRFGSDTDAAPIAETLTLPELPPDIGCVVNNSVIYGQDAYTLDSVYLTPQYVTESIVAGGNAIYYKLGDAWYDLCKPAATSSAYLVLGNAETDSAMRKLTLRYYYNGAKRFPFAKQGEKE